MSASRPSNTARPSGRSPARKLDAEALDRGRYLTLCESGQSVENLEREIFRAGFELLHPTAASGIMQKLRAEGRAERVERAKGGGTPILGG